MSKFYGRVYKLLSGLVKKLYRIEIVGAENEPEEGPFLVCANHISNQDVFMLAASLKHQVRFLAKAELFKVPIIGRLIRACGAFPVERGKGDVGAIKNTIKLLDSGEVVGIYPQGHRYAGEHPADTEVKGGIGLILTKKQIPVLPVAIQTKKFRARFFRKTKVIIGKPIVFDAFPEITGKKNDFYTEISAAVFTRICSMFDENVTPQPKNPKFLPSGDSGFLKLIEAPKEAEPVEETTDAMAGVVESMEETAVSVAESTEHNGEITTLADEDVEQNGEITTTADDSVEQNGEITSSDTLESTDGNEPEKSGNTLTENEEKE